MSYLEWFTFGKPHILSIPHERVQGAQLWHGVLSCSRDFSTHASTFIIHQTKGNHQCLCSPNLYSSATINSRGHIRLFQELSMLQSNIFPNHFTFFPPKLFFPFLICTYSSLYKWSPKEVSQNSPSQKAKKSIFPSNLFQNYYSELR